MAITTPGVSVVMTVYNGARFLAEALESIRVQTVEEMEIIVVDDGSTDSTGLILLDYAARDPRLRIIHQENGGVPKAANAGIRTARYDLIARTDADDRMLPNRLERQLAFLAEHPALDVACSFCYFINAAGKRVGSSTRMVDVERGTRELQPSRFVEFTNSTVLLRKSAFFAVGGYRDFAYAEDRDLWGRLATAGHSIACQPEFLEEFRLHGGALTMRNAAMQHELCTYIDCNVVRRLQGDPEISLEEFRAWKRHRPLGSRLRETLAFGSLHAFKKASRHYGEGRYARCALTLAAAVSLDPIHIVGRVAGKLTSADRTG